MDRTAYGTQQRKSLCLLQQLEVGQLQQLGEKGVEEEMQHMQQRAVDKGPLDLRRVETLMRMHATNKDNEDVIYKTRQRQNNYGNL